MASPSTFPQSVASFRSDVFNYDPLLAGECISRSGLIGASQGILKRGTVLGGVAVGVPPTGVTPYVAGNAPASAILAQDIDTGTGGAVTGLVYIQGKFLDTGCIFSANGAAADCAQLWNVGVYVMTVMQRSGKLVPFKDLPVTPGPLSQVATAKEAREQSKKEVEAIKAANEALPPRYDDGFPGPAPDSAWAIAAFGEPERSKEDQALEKAADATAELRLKHEKAQAELAAAQAKELGELSKKQQEERAKAAEHTQQARERAAQARLEEEEDRPTKSQEPVRPSTSAPPKK